MHVMNVKLVTRHECLFYYYNFNVTNSTINFFVYILTANFKLKVLCDINRKKLIKRERFNLIDFLLIN